MSSFPKAFRGCLLAVFGVLAGCMTTTKNGDFSLNVESIEQREVHEVRLNCYVSISPFLHWEDMPPAYQPRELVQRIVEDILSDVPRDSYLIRKITVGSRGGANSHLCGVDLLASGPAFEKLNSKSNKRVLGSFSLQAPQVFALREVDFP